LRKLSGSLPFTSQHWNIGNTGFVKGDEEMKCPACRIEMTHGKTILPYQLGAGKVIVVTGVPALICEQCGEEYIEFNIVRQVEQIITKIQGDGVQFGVVSYEQAA
jgi:YgiT-type zinc finger domain-containing protein